ncbi:MAG: o-succinylbenzoate synthase [Chloroflexaceae bacterium]|nr:o-succinylbenzoate synthase [Chloroflexaceae bacterium]
MKIDAIALHHVELPLVTPFETSFGREYNRPCILVELHAEGLVGWGECVAGSGPWYSYETIGTAWHVISEFLVPQLLGQNLDSPADLVARFGRVRGHAMARASVEAAFWDILAQAQGLSLATLIGGEKQRVAVGVSVGIEPTLPELLSRVESYLSDGYGRVKLKIKPGWDVQVVRAVRERWPDLLLQVDANSAYTLEHAPIFKAMDDLNLLLIEQPLHHEDFVDHAKLQAQLQTPICLDESIHSPEHARWALDVHACKVINIKVGRVGGLTAAKQIHDLCAERGIPVWCGGMLETNVGRAANVALATLPNFTLPGDISASDRYYREDVAAPDFVLNDDSTLSVPSAVGSGVSINQSRLQAARLRHLELRA